MSEALTVPTHFQDVAELAAGLADRVEEGRVILYGPNHYESGETIPFAILLADGSPLIEGHGVVAAAIDGGEDRDAAFRYDVVLTELQMDARSEIMFARILMSGDDASRETAMPDEGGFEQVDVSSDPAEDLGGFQDESTAVADLSAHAAAMMPAAKEPGPDESSEDVPVEDEDVPASTEVEPEAFSVTTGEFVERDAEVANDDEDRFGASDPYTDDYATPAEGAGSVIVDGAMAPPSFPAAPPGFTVARLADVGLSRPVHAATWWPEPSPRPEPEPSTGAFEYSGALPIPAQPPRPELDPSQRVAPAPHPIAEGQAVVAAAPAVSAHATVDEHAATYAAEDEGAYADNADDVEDDYADAGADAADVSADDDLDVDLE
ncbi:MAG: hypothetical protein H6726_08210 [Sandaracinaceae bacterium]|nr:hypothetical protein [Myxococcales bacterium]MCB9657613.1 hypothetical protein [Sandaracinaceae bacterium]